LEPGDTKIMVLKIQKLKVLSTLVAMAFCSGCGFVGALGTPTPYESEIAAEYELVGDENRKILVLVEQPAWLSTDANLRFYLTELINENLVRNAEIGPKQLIGYRKLSEQRRSRANFSELSPVEIGETLGANIVLFVMIEDYRLSGMGETNYYKGFLAAQSVLFDVATNRKVWPESAKSRAIRVGFEVERQGREVAFIRLVNALAHCLVRYFYDCPWGKFKIADDRSGVGWENWER